MSARTDLTDQILAAKSRLGLTWATIAATLGDSSVIIYTAALLGQFPLTADEAAKAVALLELDPAAASLLTRSPDRGAGVVMPPTDPLIYRFYELVQNYGHTWKQLIEEESATASCLPSTSTCRLPASLTPKATASKSKCPANSSPSNATEANIAGTVRSPALKAQPIPAWGETQGN